MYSNDTENDPFDALFNWVPWIIGEKKTECPEGRMAATYMHARDFHAAALVSKQEKRERVILDWTNKNPKGAGPQEEKKK
jgi:hypothetical protein